MSAEIGIKLGQGKRGVEDSLSYSWGHEFRIKILAILNEGCYSPEELSKTLRLWGSSPSSGTGPLCPFAI